MNFRAHKLFNVVQEQEVILLSLLYNAHLIRVCGDSVKRNLRKIWKRNVAWNCQQISHMFCPNIVPFHAQHIHLGAFIFCRMHWFKIVPTFKVLVKIKLPVFYRWFEPNIEWGRGQGTLGKNSIMFSGKRVDFYSQMEDISNTEIPKVFSRQDKMSCVTLELLC